MFTALRTLFSRASCACKHEQPALRLAVFAATTEGSTGYFIELIIKHLKEILGTHITTVDYTHIVTPTQLKQAAYKLKTHPVNLIFACELLPVDHVSTLQSEYGITIPAVTIIHEGFAPSPPPPCMQTLIYPDFSEEVIATMQSYRPRLKQVIIAARSSTQHTLPMLINMRKSLEKKGVTVVPLMADREHDSLPIFMEKYGLKSDFLYVYAESIALNLAPELTPLAHAYNCRVISSGSTDLQHDIDAFVGITIDDIAQRIAHQLARAHRSPQSSAVHSLKTPIIIKFSRTRRPQVSAIEHLLTQLPKHGHISL